MIDVDMPQSDGLVRGSAMACMLGLGGFLGWSGFVPLEEGVATGGKVIVENDRQVVQHFEGGIVETVHVREGAFVEAGDVVVTLRETASLSNRDQLRSQIAALLATEARLDALLSGKPAPDFSALDELGLDRPTRMSLEGEETTLLERQSQALEAELAVLRNRRAGLRRTAELRAEQIDRTRDSLAIAVAERDRLDTLVAQQMARRDQLTRAERDVAALEADLVRLGSEREDAMASALEAERQMEQVRAEARRNASAELRDARAERLAAEDSLTAAQDVLDRAVILAPVSGEVLNLRFTTEGAVIPSGETIMEIVPEEARLVASVRVRPTDRASVNAGQTVRTQISAYRSWQSPRLSGEVQSVSADLKTDPVSGADYYEARVLLDTSSINTATDFSITPGMPVDVFIYSGQSRTTLDYLFAPLSESLFKGLRSG